MGKTGKLTGPLAFHRAQLRPSLFGFPFLTITGRMGIKGSKTPPLFSSPSRTVLTKKDTAATLAQSLEFGKILAPVLLEWLPPTYTSPSFGLMGARWPFCLQPPHPHFRQKGRGKSIRRVATEAVFSFLSQENN